MEKRGFTSKFLNETVLYLKENMGILIGLLLMCIFMTTQSQVFLTWDNISNVFRQVTTNANLAFGMTFAIILCGIDLSVGSILGLSGTLTAGLIAINGVPVPLAILIGLSVGTALGFINGFIIAKTNMPPFIVTLAMMQIARGAAYVYTDGMPIRVMVDAYNQIGIGYLGPIPLPVIYTAILFVFTAILLGKTKYGRYVYAVGGNENAARFSGINIERVKIIAHTLIGFLAAISGIVLCARMYSGQPTAGNGAEMDAIAAVVLGGTSFSGGIGKIGGTIIGVFIIGILNNGLNLLNVNSFWQLIAKGLVILLAVYIDILKKKVKTK